MYHLNGELVADEDASVSVRDRGFRYGDGAFETLRAYGGEVFAWRRHRERLVATCEALGMPAAVPEDLALRVAETLEANGHEDAYVRVTVTRGVQPGKLSPRGTVDPTVVVETRPLPRGGVDGEPVWDDHADLQTVRTRRIPSEAVPADAKTCNYLNGILARLELRRAATETFSADAALLRDVDGAVMETATANLFFVDDGVLKTPAADDLLPGITREIVLELADEEAFPVETGRYDPEAIRGADEAFLTNTTWELRPVAGVDNVPVGDGPVTRLLTRLYDQRVERTCYADR